MKSNRYLLMLMVPAALILLQSFCGIAMALPGSDVLQGAVSVGDGNGEVSLNGDGSVTWMGHGGDSDVEKVFLESGVLEAGLSSTQGTIVVQIQRDEVYHREAVFSLANSSYERLFVLRVYWEGNEGTPDLRFFGGGITDLWYVTDPEYFNYPKAHLPFPEPVNVGEVVQVALTWGAPDGSQIYVNGKSLGALTGDNFVFPAKVASATKLIIGAETSTKIPDGAWSMTSSLIRSFNVMQRGLTAEEVAGLMPDTIRSVAHDAFSVAGYSGKLVAGDVVTVTLQAGTGGSASFDIVEPASTVDDTEKVRVANVPLAEVQGNAGTYMGTYTVKSGELAKDGLVVGKYTNSMGLVSQPLAAGRPVDIDGTTHIVINTSNDLVPADESARAGLTVVAADANGDAVTDREIKLTLSTTDEYTGNVGGITFEDLVGGEIDVDWGGVTDSFGEVTAQYVSGFAAKTILVSAKDMVSGDVGVGWVRSYIDGEVDIVVTEPRISALSVAGSMDVSLSRDWLTADGRSRSRITAVVEDANGGALSGHNIQFTLLGDNGSIRTVQGRTDARGRAYADYIAGTVMGQVQVEVRDLTSGLTAVVSIELRPDAPAEIALAADPGEVVTGGESMVTATVTDANGNPNHDVDVLYNLVNGVGELGSPSAATDEDGVASVTFTAGDTAGLVTVRGTVISREPTAGEISAAEGAVFLYGLDEDPGRLEVVEWLVEAGDEVVEGQELVVLEDRSDTVYRVTAPRDGVVSTFAAEERDRVEYGDTLGYVLEVSE